MRVGKAAPPVAQLADPQLARTRRLLADDRAGHLVPSIREAEICADGPKGQRRVLRPPSVEQASWRDPADTTPNASKAPRRIRAVRRANNLRWLQKRGVPLSRDHITAGAIYEADHEMGMVGKYPGAPPPEIRGTPGPGDYSRSVDRGRAFKAAQALIGPMGADLLRHVVLGREGAGPGDIASWARGQSIGGRPVTERIAPGMLIAVLEVLVSHYGRRIRDFQKLED